MNRELNGSKILKLLKDFDDQIKEPCKIIVCGGAAAIIGFGLNRHTGDIDILEPKPKSDSFNNVVKNFSEIYGLDKKWLNDGVKGFVDYLSPGYRSRLISINHNFKNLEVFVISKPDLITMKICAWREADKEDVKFLGISNDDLLIINENIKHLERHSPDIAQKAQLVLSELGFSESKKLNPEEVSNLAELIQYFSQCKGCEPELSDIKKWKDEIGLGLKPGFIAKTLNPSNSIEEPSLGMDI